MGRVIRMPVPVGANVQFTCPDKHSIGWELHGTDTSEYGTFAKFTCRKCGYEMYGELIWALPPDLDDDE